MLNNLKNPQPGTNPLSTDAAQLYLLLNALADVGLLQLAAPQATPVAPTVADSGLAGNLNGAYYWKVVLITGWQQNDGSYYVNGFVPSADSAQLTLTNHSANLTAIATGTSSVIGRAIYRTAAGGAAGTEKFVAVIWDNTTSTYTDNIADASLGTGMPTSTSNPAAYGTAIPASVPATNTTGTSLAQLNVYPTTNSGNAYSASPTGVISYYDGLLVTVKFNAASTGAITVNFNGLGAKSVVDYFGNPVTNVRANLIANLRYEATSGNFILLGKGGGGNATAAQLLSGATATVDSGPIIGTIPSKTVQTYTPGTANQTITAGQYLSGDQTISGDANLVPANLIGTIFGVAGTAKRTASGVITLSYNTVTAISGLGFTPKIIIAKSTTAADYRSDTTAFIDASLLSGGLSGTIYIDGNGALQNATWLNVVSGGFSLKTGNASGVTVFWKASE